MNQPMHYTLAALNHLPETEAYTAFENCCCASAWVTAMVKSRPFASLEQLQQEALKIWNSLGENDFLEAFEGHPKIGDVSSLKAKYAHTKALASGEQSSVQVADDEVLEALARGNQAYEQKFGFIFIVCATGKSAAEMLALLEARLPNERADELRIAAEQQSQITAIRLNKLITGDA